MNRKSYLYLLIALIVGIVGIARHPTIHAAIITSESTTVNQSDEALLQQSGDAQNIRISEIAPIADATHGAWVEFTLTGELYQTMLPLASGRSETSATTETLTPPIRGNTLEGWYFTNRAGIRYNFPALPNIPNRGIVVVQMTLGTDDLDFGDGVVTLYAPNYGFNPAGDLLSLHRADGSIADFIVWGQSAGAGDDQAVAAELWVDEGFVVYDQGFGETVHAAPPRADTSIGAWSGQWVAYDTDTSSRGHYNPPPTPMHSTLPDTATLDSDTFGMAWTGVLDKDNTLRYHFQLARDVQFTDLVVDERLEFPGWNSDGRMPEGTYYWRVRIVPPRGGGGAWTPPHQTTSVDAFATTVQVTLLNSSQQRLQRKDTTMLDIGGGTYNFRILDEEKDLKEEWGSRRNESMVYNGTFYADWNRNVWDHPHEFPNGMRSYDWNGYDSMHCTRASVAMMNAYYGGNLSVDRIVYWVFEEDPNSGKSAQDVPENDGGFNEGGRSAPALAWALQIDDDNIGTAHYCPKPDPDDEEPCEESFISWADITTRIDAEQPFITIIPGHVRVADGYKIVGNQRFVRLLDPVPNSCNDAKCGEPRWIAYEDFRKTHIASAWIEDASLVDARHDEASIYRDSDKDGVNDFDETRRFFTDAYNMDTDYDGVNDKEDIAEYTFEGDIYRKYVADIANTTVDPDTLRKELDWDNDDDGSPDGCEDVNGNGVREFGETWNYDPLAGLECQPWMTLWEPSKFDVAAVGTTAAPKTFTIKLYMTLPPMIEQPTYSKFGFTVKVGNNTATILNQVQNGGYVQLLVKAPTQFQPGLYDLHVNYDDGILRAESESADAVKYGASAHQNTFAIFQTTHVDPTGGTIAPLRSAMNFYIAQWRIGDGFGLVQNGNGGATTIYPLTIIEDESTITTLQGRVNALPFGGSGSLGAALELVEAELSSTQIPTDTRTSVVSLTTGASTVAPFASSLAGDNNFDGWVNPDDRTATNQDPFTYPVAAVNAPLGGTTPISETVDVANSTGGLYFHAAPTASLPSDYGNRTANALKLAAEASMGETRVGYAVGALSFATPATHPIQVDGSSQTLVVAIHTAAPNAGTLVVVRPDGSQVQAGDSDATIRTGAQFTVIRMDTPTLGTWTVRVQGSSPSSNGVEYVFMASADSDVHLSMIHGAQSVSALAENPYYRRTIVPAALLNDSNAPILGGVVNATLVREDGVVMFTEQLRDNGQAGDTANDGIYTGTQYNVPADDGYTYTLIVTATGTANGQPFVRHTQQSY